MSQEYASLALDDIVHIMSPSPAPQVPADGPEMLLRTQSLSPEPLQGSDILQMRKRVMEMNIYRGDSHAGALEKELADMVLRLTSSPIPDVEQLVRQADMISALTLQRDLLVYQAEEQRLKWLSEQDSWNRMAEALILQQAKGRTAADRDDETERINDALDSENKSLRQRFNEAQFRLQMLESELLRLRPVLLMQPPTSRSPMATPRRRNYHRKRRKDTNYLHTATEDEGQDASEEEAGAPSTSEALETPTTSQRSQTTPKSKSCRSETNNAYYQPSITPHKRRSFKNGSRGLSADARVEHLLLAARKVGKERATIMSGIMHHIQERERERRREHTASTAVAATPKTPKRVAPHPSYVSEAGYIYLSSPIPPGTGMQPIPVFVPTYAPSLLKTPSSSTTVASATSPAHQLSKQGPRVQNPQTPLDSLLNAARSMMRTGDVGNDQEVGRRGGLPLIQEDDMPDSPLPKRRKLAARETAVSPWEIAGSSANLALTDTVGKGGTSPAVGRVRSALDVLADQAAAFSFQAASHQVPPQGKGKGKEKADSLGSSKFPANRRERAKLRCRDTETHGSPFEVPPTVAAPNLVSGMSPLNFSQDVPVSEAPADPGGITTKPSSHQTDAPQSPAGNRDNTLHEATEPHSSHSSPIPPDQNSETTPIFSLQPPIASQPHLRSRSESIPSVTFVLPSHLEPPVSSEKQEVDAVTAIRDGAPLTLDSHQRSETAPAAIQVCGENSGTACMTARNKTVARVAGQNLPPPKRQRSPYVKWSKEEDELLAQAVAKYGQKWDLVQKALPSRGYHQVRQRWLRKLGVFDSKPDLSSFQTAAPTLPIGSTSSDPPPNPKLGLAPLSSEIAFSSFLSGRGGSRPSTPS